MKIKVREMRYEDALALQPDPPQHPKKPALFFRTLLRTLSAGELRSTHFTHTELGMEKLGKDEPCLILMNHSSFIDLKIVSTLWYPRPFNIVCTSDGFVGKAGLMRALGCIPTRKFCSDTTLVREMLYAVRKLKTSLLLYPEASYSFDGTATPLPESIGKCVKMLGVPVVMIRTYGAFAHDPLYNGLQLRDVPVSAEVKYLLSPEECRELSVGELNARIFAEFDFDNFRWQRENKIAVREPFRADGLNRVLYRCPHCQSEGKTVGKGTVLRCENCGAEYELDEYGALRCRSGEGKFDHVPDWYAWERAEVRRELEDGSYCLDIPVDICMMVNTECICRVGTGRLRHDTEGFRLTGCDGQLDYRQKPESSYSLYADYFWYEIGDVICIGDRKALYYCFPQGGGDIVAKTRLAAEELYKLKKG